MKSPVKRHFWMVLVFGILVLLTALAALFAGTHLGSWEMIKKGITSSLVNTEAVWIMVAMGVVVVLALGALCYFVMRLSLPLWRKYRLEQQTRKQLKRSDSRFPALQQLDKQLHNSEKPTYSDPTLDEICRDFRWFAADKLQLYYDIEDIRRFIAGMGISSLVILRGMSGTGKTSLAYAAGEYFGNASTIVPIQPMWKERSDILGYFNEFTKRFNETRLLTKLYEAGGTDDVYITVLDEVNIARIEYYFAEFLSLLEIPDPQKRTLNVVPDSWSSDPERIVDGKLVLPENMWFIGTANNDDSTFSISDKVYDRAAVLDLEKKSESFSAPDTQAGHISYSGLRHRFEEALECASLSPAGTKAIRELDDYLSETFRISFGNRIMRQLERYVPIMIACGGTENGALDDFLTRKILRKLEQLSPALLHRQIPELQQRLDALFGSQALPQCRAFLERLSGSV